MIEDTEAILDLSMNFQVIKNSMAAWTARQESPVSAKLALTHFFFYFEMALTWDKKVVPTNLNLVHGGTAQR